MKMASHTSKFEAMPLMEKDEDWEDPDDLVLGPLNSVLENMKYNSRTISHSELWKAILFASTLSFVAGVTVPYIFYSLIFHHCAPDISHIKTFEGVSENVFLEIKEDGIKSWQRKLDELNSSMLPLYIKEEWQKQGLDKVTIVSHNIAFSLPNKKKANKLLIKDLQEEFSHSTVNDDSSYIKPLCCASAIGTIQPIQGDPLFANFGRYEDFMKLSRLNIDINDKIVIMKYGMVPTASKVLLAQKFGASGVILFPAKPSRVKNIKMSNVSCHILLPDETVHFCPASGDQFLFWKVDFSTIPVYPITNEDAENILRSLAGLDEPADWNNRKSLSYKIGPGFAEKYKKIRMEIYTEDVNWPFHSAVGKLNGKLETDRSIMLGSLSRSKNFTGFSILLEISKIFAKSLKHGIRPRRSILFCAWGSGDYFATHSINEWIKDHQEHLGAEAVTYIDIDASLSTGHYQFIGTPMLIKEISEVIQKVLDKKEHDANLMIAEISNSSSLNDRIKSSFQVTNVGGHMPFYNVLGIPCLHLQYDCNSVTPCQSIVDCSSNEMFKEDFRNIVTLAQIWTKIIHSLSHSIILNLDITGLVIHLNHSIKDLEGRYGKLFEKNSISLSNLNDNIEEFTIVAESFQKIIKGADSESFYMIRSINDKLMRIGRSFIGISFPSKTFSRKNLLYGSSNLFACNMTSFPGVTDQLLELNISDDAKHTQIRKDLQEQIALLSSHIKSATEVLQSDI